MAKRRSDHHRVADLEAFLARYDYILHESLARQHRIYSSHGSARLPLEALRAANQQHERVMRALGLDRDRIHAAIKTVPQATLLRIDRDAASIVPDAFKQQVKQLLYPKRDDQTDTTSREGSHSAP